MEGSTRHGVGFAPWRIAVGAAACLALLLCAQTAAAQAAPPLDHFLCYASTGPAVNEGVYLMDQFATAFVPATVGKPAFFCNPTKKVHGGVVFDILHPASHLEWYAITLPTGPRYKVTISNQFNPPTGVLPTLNVTTAKWLAVPTQKDNIGPYPQPPDWLDHFKCYVAAGPAVYASVASVYLEDQFESLKQVVLLKPTKFCNPVVKERPGHPTTPILHPEAHLVCYDIVRPVKTKNQFRQETFAIKMGSLCVPSLKVKWSTY